MNRVKQWNNARQELKKEYFDKGITRCELCNTDNFLGFAHFKKRIEYYSHPELLGKFSQTLLLCNNCHAEIEVSKKLTKKTFLKLRGEQTLNDWKQKT